MIFFKFVPLTAIPLPLILGSLSTYIVLYVNVDELILIDNLIWHGTEKRNSETLSDLMCFYIEHMVYIKCTKSIVAWCNLTDKLTFQSHAIQVYCIGRDVLCGNKKGHSNRSLFILMIWTAIK